MSELKTPILIVHKENVFSKILNQENVGDYERFLLEPCFLDGNFTVQTLLEEIKEGGYGIVIFDVLEMDFVVSGIVLELRKESDVKIILYPSIIDKQDAIKFLDSGIDDVFVSSYSPEEINARIMRIITRGNSMSFKKTSIEDNNIEIDLKNKTVISNGKELSLTPIEYRILLTLMLSRGVAVEKERVENKVFFTKVKSNHLLNTHISNLRKKCGKRSGITTVSKRGFLIKSETP